jgi:hypothetical protein
MNDDEREMEASGTEEIDDNSGPEGGVLDVSEERGEIEKEISAIDAGAPNDIGGDGRSDEAGSGLGNRVPCTAMNGGDVARRIERTRDRARETGGADEKAMAGVISRIERLENWVKTNRLG